MFIWLYGKLSLKTLFSGCSGFVGHDLFLKKMLVYELFIGQFSYFCGLTSTDVFILLIL